MVVMMALKLADPLVAMMVVSLVVAKADWKAGSTAEQSVANLVAWMAVTWARPWGQVSSCTLCRQLQQHLCLTSR